MLDIYIFLKRIDISELMEKRDAANAIAERKMKGSEPKEVMKRKNNRKSRNTIENCARHNLYVAVKSRLLIIIITINK